MMYYLVNHHHTIIIIIIIIIIIMNQHNRINATQQPKICPAAHIRNDLKSLETLRGCDIIDGPLTIALVGNDSQPYQPKDYENITFPQLREITDYLLLFRVQGLSSLSTLFPNLSVIRGRELVSNYALVIYEMHLKSIDLPKLTDILRGSVRIESNHDLCHVSTVNWEGICKHIYTQHFIRDNNQRCNNYCPEHCRPWYNNNNKPSSDDLIDGDVERLGAENNHSLFCWNSQVCHEAHIHSDGLALPIAPDGGSCSPQCAGGCYQANRSDQCISCRNFLQKGRCVELCDEDLFEYKGRCINEQECITEIERPTQRHCTKNIDQFANFKAIKIPGERNNRCQTECPTGFEEDPSNPHQCKPCDDGKCSKVCNPDPDSGKYLYTVTSVTSLKEVAGCNVINGSLEISIKGGKNVLHELKTAFQELREIRGYLKVTRSYPIITLGFFKNLAVIEGFELERDEYALTIMDNPNLQDLFTFNHSDISQKPLKINRGKVSAHLNPKLCPSKIQNLKTYASVADWNGHDVSQHTNGDKELCNTVKLDLQFVQATAKIAMLRFPDYAREMDDPRILLYYLVNYRVVPIGTVTMYDGRDGCNNQNDLWITREEEPVSKKKKTNDVNQEVVLEVAPATRYAAYVKTFTIQGGSVGALSDIIYFETAPDTPEIPRSLESDAKSHDSVIISWFPPARPNGLIERYHITVTFKPTLEQARNIDVCESTQHMGETAQSQAKAVPTRPASDTGVTNSKKDSEESCCRESCSAKSESHADADTHMDVVTFQDKVISAVYLKRQCDANTNTSKPVKKKRSISATEYDFSDPNNSSLPQDSKKVIDSQNESSNTMTKNAHKENSTLIFDSELGITHVNISADNYKPNTRISFSILGLSHFSQYEIQVAACHGTFVGNSTRVTKDYKQCGLAANLQIETLGIEKYDKVAKSTIAFYPANESVSVNTIKWSQPERPNGNVKAYRVRYRPKQTELWTEGCINMTTFEKHGGFVFSHINPGLYEFSVQTITTYTGARLWSDELDFEVPQDYLVSPTVLTLSVIIFVVLLLLSVASGTYYYQKRKHQLVYASVNPDYIQYDPDEWEVDKKNLIIGPQIGTGSFGMVSKGQMITEKGTYECAVKTVPAESTAKQRMDFLREASIMKQFDTYHVVKLMGVVSVTTPVYVIMEYMENGDLKEFLRGQRDKHQKENKPLVDGIYLMAAQIADGMAYLASKKFVHRDLAARNCMVSESRVVKIGDFGLTRDIYANDYYRRDTQGRMPVRWMAPESLKDNIFTSASDVWSYGIVVWEMVTFSAFPYQGIPNEEVWKRVINGHRLARPDNCSDKLYNIMERCWRNERDRPTFCDIVEHLLPETEGRLYPNCFYRKSKVEGDSIAQSLPEETHTGTESYPLLSWPPSRANGLTNGVNHTTQPSDNDDI